jgi:hypothetical protein
VTPTAADEAARAPGASPWWSDTWQLDAAAADGTGLTVRLECYPNRGQAWFWTYLVLPDLDGPIVVRDHEVTLPRQGLEIRAEGLWAELWCETPLEHWTYGLEAFAVRLDDPADALTGEIGERLPIGLDLEWETDGSLHAHADTWTRPGYVAPGTVHGEVLLGRERFELDATGEHHRTWGDRAWDAIGAWSIACGAPDVSLHVEGTADGRTDGFARLGGRPVAVGDARREAHAGAARVVLDASIEVDIEVRNGAPVPIETLSVADRAVCRFQVDDHVAYGWSCALQPAARTRAR